MEDRDIIGGFVPGIVTDNDDPEGTGRIKCRIPGIFDTEAAPYWILPANWPGAIGVHHGSQYPPPDVESHVYIMFERGIYLEPESRAIYFTGYYGLDENYQTAGPPVIAAVAAVERTKKRCAIWEDGDFIISVINDDEITPPDKRVTIQTKAGGSMVELNAADGDGGGSETIRVEARTQVSIYSQGSIDISGLHVQIQGRIVDPLSSGSI